MEGDEQGGPPGPEGQLGVLDPIFFCCGWLWVVVYVGVERWMGLTFRPYWWLVDGGGRGEEASRLFLSLFLLSLPFAHSLCQPRPRPFSLLPTATRPP